MSPTWRVTEWAAQDASARTPTWKRAIYWALRPVLDADGRRHLSREALARWRPDFVFTRRGLPLEDRRKMALARTHVPAATLLVQGTGSGWDVISWAELRPRRIIATDAVAFAESWEGIARHCRDSFGVPVEFHEAPLESCPFVASESIDVAASDAVLEHVRDMPAVLAETRRLLKSGGRMYASVGPLWFTAAGDHFSARAGIDDVFAHIDRSAEDYRRFFERHRQPVEDFQSGGRYVEIDLFSKLTMDEYLAAFSAQGLRQEYLAIQTAQLTLDYERRHPERARRLLERYPGRVTRDDLRVVGFVIRLCKSSSSL